MLHGSQRGQTEMVWTSSDSEYIGRMMQRLEVAHRRPGGRPMRRFMNLVKEKKHGVSRCGEKGCRGQGQIEADDWLWRTLKEPQSELYMVWDL